MTRLIDKYLPGDYHDCVSCCLKSGVGLSPEVLFDRMFCQFPKAMVWLMRLRDLMVRPLGLQGGGSFRDLVSEKNDEEIVACKNDRHLCFWVSVFCSLPAEGGQEVAVTIVVKFHHFWGRLYFAVIWLFHKILVKSLFRRAVKEGAQ